MSRRLATGGRLIDRSATVSFTFDGARQTGHPGDTLASALMAAGCVVTGRSFKYHRPRGVVDSGVAEPNALMGLGTGPRHEPNRPATTTELFEGLTAQSQNRWPSLARDVGVINDWAARFLPAGFYYKTFLRPRRFWKHVFEPAIRRAAGLGNAPEEPDADRYEHFHAHPDVLVVGGGVAGLQAARSAAEAGAGVLLIEQSPHWGGRAPVDGARIDGRPAEDWVAGMLARLDALPDFRRRARMTGAGVYDHGFVLAAERLAEHVAAPDGPRHRLWKIRARHIVTATGAQERPLAFAGNDLPGVMLASAVRDFVVDRAVAPGERTVIVTNNDDAYRTALVLSDAGLEVPVVVDARPGGGGALARAVRARGIRVADGRAVVAAHGRGRVEGVGIALHSGAGDAVEHVACDAVAMSGGWSPIVHLWSHRGGKLLWEEAGAFFRPDPARAPIGADGAALVTAAGAANGALAPDAALAGAHAAGLAAAGRPCSEAGPPPAAEAEAEAPLLPVWRMPARAGPALRAKMWLDFQNDVKVADLRLAAQEGFESVEHAKRYTTLGMATDQGKLSNINGLATLAEALDEAIPRVGTTTFRPPYTPVPLGAIAGEAAGGLFQPVRRTPIHGWHEAAGARWEPVGQWRRPYAYPRAGESVADAVQREARNARTHLGLLDSSTLGKLHVAGPDAGRFLDMLYTNTMSSLKMGRCRYGLMCSENGFLIDDGVVARTGEQSFLCHTTSGGTERIHAHMEEWLQTQWWDWQVYVANLTEQYAQIAVVGPNARKALEALGGMDEAVGAMRFMDWADGTLAGHELRVFRISFSGELSFELRVRASEGLALWEKLLEAGADLGVMPYGTEALHILRAEKGLIMIGDETDGTVIPQDLGLDWAISKKKDDYLGRRAQQRPHMTDPERWKLVGLATEDGSVLPEGAYAVAEGENENGQRNVQGRVTSTYHSPNCGRGIAMGLVRRGPERMGEVLDFARTDGTAIPARLVPPLFHDPDGGAANA